MATGIHGTETVAVASPRGAGGDPRSRRGVAILMVVLILAALISIAAPFAISMHLYERSSRHFRDTVRARLAAEGAVAHAISCLRRTEDAAETDGRYGEDWTTPDVDTQKEFDVDFSFDGKFERALKEAGVAFDDPKGVMWSANVEDEQGKINVISAPPRTLGIMLGPATLAADAPRGASVLVLDDATSFVKNDDPAASSGSVRLMFDTVDYSRVSDNSLEGLTWRPDPNSRIGKYKAGTLVYDAAAKKIADAGMRGEFKTIFDVKRYLEDSPRSLCNFERLQPCLTVHSFRDTNDGWLTRQEVEAGVSPTSTEFRVRSVAGFGQGARVKMTGIRRDTDGVVWTRIKRISWVSQQGQWGRFRTFTQLGASRNDPQSDTPLIVFAQAEQFHPVNVNTATPFVLTALFAGLGEGRRSVTLTEAETIADYIYYYVREDERFVEGGKPVGSQADFREMMERCRRSGWFGDGIARSKIDAICQDATARICFKAYGNFTIEAAGAVNTPAGEESARHVIRQLVTMPVDSGGEWSISSQKDFDEQIQRLVGPKTETWPFTEAPRSGSALDKYKQGMDPATGVDKVGYVTLETGHAGGANVEHFDKASTRWMGQYSIQHHAAKLKGGIINAAGGKVFEKSDEWVKPFTFEGWFKPNSSFTGLGLSAGDANRNGVSLSYAADGYPGGTGYVLTVADACAGQDDPKKPWLGPAEFRFEAPRTDGLDWYHLAMQVKGTSPGEALVWVDGVVSRGNPIQYSPGTRLAQALPLDVPKVGPGDDLLSKGVTVYVDKTDDFPGGTDTGGTIIIDGEVMEYAKKTSTTFEECRRARRYTHLADHRTGAVVTPYGYSVKLKTNLFRSEAKLASALGPNPVSVIPAKLVPNPLGGPDIPDTLAEDDMKIPLVNSSDFQDTGIVKIGSEYILFEKNDRKTSTLTARERGYDIDDDNTSAPEEHSMNGSVVVRQISIACTGMEPFDFEAQPKEGKDQELGSEVFHYASIKHEDADDKDSDDFEWFRLEYEHTHTADGITYVLGAYVDEDDVDKVRGDLSWRGQLGTTIKALEKGTAVLPVVQLAGPQCGDEDSPRGPDPEDPDALEEFEAVTPVQGERAEDSPLLITHSSCVQHRWRSKSNLPYHHYLVFRASFDKPITGDTYAKNNGRILKFPSGEFLRKIPATLKIGGPNGAGFVGAIDELRTDTAGKRQSAVLEARFTVGDEPPFTKKEPKGLPSAETTIAIMAPMATDGACTPVQRGNNDDNNAARDVKEPVNKRGVVMIGDELIWYDSWSQTDDTEDIPIPWGREQRTDEKYCPYHDWDTHDPNCTRYMKTITLDDCVRGILGTDGLQSDHAAGERVTFFEGIPLTTLSNALARGSDKLSVRDSDTFPAEGYAIVSDPSELAAPGRGEIVGWTSNTKRTGITGCKYLRGRFGTSEQRHFAGDFCQLLPFRYWDRWNYDFDNDSELAYFQCSYAARDAYWQEIEWQESGYTGGAASDRVRLRVVCRFDGKPEWNERPTNTQGGLWEFTGGGRQTFRSAGGGPLKADSIEVRVYWEYLNGAWDVDVNDWKRNVRLDNLVVTFGNPLIVRKVDLLDY